MRLVPRQLRRTNVKGSVPYYGGRLTPQVIAGIEQQAARGQDVHAELEAALQTLLRHGMLTKQEHEDIARRIAEAR